MRASKKLLKSLSLSNVTGTHVLNNKRERRCAGDILGTAIFVTSLTGSMWYSF